MTTELPLNGYDVYVSLLLAYIPAAWWGYGFWRLSKKKKADKWDKGLVCALILPPLIVGLVAILGNWDGSKMPELPLNEDDILVIAFVTNMLCLWSVSGLFHIAKIDDWDWYGALSIGTPPILALLAIHFLTNNWSPP